MGSSRDHDRAESRPRGHRTSLNVASSTSGPRPVNTSTAPQRRTRLRRRWLLLTCARDLLEKTRWRWRDSRYIVLVVGMRLSLFVSSQHVQNTSFCVGDASRTSYTYTFLLYSRTVHIQTDTQVLQNEHTRALSGRLPPAEPSDARCERARQREAPSGRQQARKARSRLSGTCVPTHARSGIDTCQSHLSKSPVGKHLSETPVKVTCHSHLPNELAMGVRLGTQWGVRVQSTRCAHRVESSRTSSRRRND